MKWVCCQLGAREHYAIPRALYRVGMLGYLVTDAWVPPSSLLAKVCGHSSKFRHRFHSELRDARVKAFNSSLVLFEMLAGARASRGWPKILARNRWFQRKVVAYLSSSRFSVLGSQPIVFGYSYAAREIFRFAKSHGWRTVLGQIDPGPVEEEIVAAETEREASLAPNWRRAPADYWKSWREECDVADRIIVNSEWSSSCLVKAGVNDRKLFVVPLGYESPITDTRITREYPPRFTPDRPLRVLFLGLINLRKGVARLLEAARILRDEPVEFWMVGPVEIANASTITDPGRVKWFGAVTGNQAAGFYRNADLFILPTLSDGFAITQLEAQAHGLPVIASKNCGKVVENGVNGSILDEPSAACIAHAVHDCIASPDRLEKLASASGVRDEFTIDGLAQQLHELGATLSFSAPQGAA
jgi:glycosyltransferase involved in cell wall biosynthesis